MITRLDVKSTVDDVLHLMGNGVVLSNTGMLHRPGDYQECTIDGVKLVVLPTHCGRPKRITTGKGAVVQDWKKLRRQAVATRLAWSGQYAYQRFCTKCFGDCYGLDVDELVRKLRMPIDPRLRRRIRAAKELLALYEPEALA